MATKEERELRGARRQSLFREVNERIEATSEEQRVLVGTMLCECATDDCTALVLLGLDEYEAMRRVPTRFVVAPGHEILEIERVVDRTERYLVVEKLGKAAEAAVQLNPRRRSRASLPSGA